MHVAPELLAALLEGRLAKRDRRDVIAHAATCAECCAVLAETMICLDNLQPQENPMPYPTRFSNPRNLVAGDRVETTTGKIVRGQLHHFNELGQAYVDGAERGGPSYVDPAHLQVVPADVPVTKRQDPPALTVPVADFVAAVELLLATVDAVIAEDVPLRGRGRLEVANDRVARLLGRSTRG